MQQQAELLLYKFRFVFGTLVIISFIVLLCAAVTAFGAGSPLAIKAAPADETVALNIATSSNAVTATAANITEKTKYATLATGNALYGACKSVSNVAEQTSYAVGHSIATTARGIGTGSVFVVRGVGSSFLFMFRTTATVTWFMVRLPLTVTGSVASGRAVQTVITPAASKPLPVISGSLSDEFKDRITEQAQQDAASEQSTLEQFAAQAEANRDLGGSIVAGDPGHGGYPAQWDSPARQDSMIDNWGMFNRECVSYAAWKVYQTYGNMPYWGGIGNANQWLRNARAAGIPTGAAPKAQSVAISLAGYYGHAMWVEKVDGDMIYVSQYNYDLHGHYSEMWVSASYFTYIYFGDN